MRCLRCLRPGLTVHFGLHPSNKSDRSTHKHQTDAEKQDTQRTHAAQIQHRLTIVPASHSVQAGKSPAKHGIQNIEANTRSTPLQTRMLTLAGTHPLTHSHKQTKQQNRKLLVTRFAKCAIWRGISGEEPSRTRHANGRIHTERASRANRAVNRPTRRGNRA